MTIHATPLPAARPPQLRGQTAIIIGGSAGIGLATARLARAEGAEVIVTGRNPERLQRAADELGARGSAAFDAGYRQLWPASFRRWTASRWITSW